MGRVRSLDFLLSCTVQAFLAKEETKSHYENNQIEVGAQKLIKFSSISLISALFIHISIPVIIVVLQQVTQDEDL